METDVRASLSRVVGYIGPDDHKVFSWLHYCPDVPTAETGVVICAPLGVEYMNSHRSLRHIADEYACAGIPALRFDYLGTGDSADADPAGNQLEFQLQSIQIAIEAIRQEVSLSTVGLFGFRFGATLAALFSQRQEVEFLSLWAPVVKGRQYLREIKLLQRVNSEQSKEDFLEAGGLVINPLTEQACKDINLLTLEPRCQRALVIPSDEISNLDTLCESWRQPHREITQLVLQGSSDMLMDAHFSNVPLAEIAQLVESSSTGLVGRSQSPCLQARETSMSVAGFYEGDRADISCHLIESACPGFMDKNFYLLTEAKTREGSSDLPVVIFLNSGANHHVGSNRLYVLLSRQLACLGFTCARADLPGLGDGFIDDLKLENITYIPELSKHIGSLVTAIKCRIPGKRLVLAGLCSGAYGAFVSSLELADHGIDEGLLINPLTFYWKEGMSLETAPSRHYQNWNWHMRSIKQPSQWLKLLRGQVNISLLLRDILTRVQIKLIGWKGRLRFRGIEPNQALISGNLPADLAKIENNKIHLSLVLSDGDPGLDILMTDAGANAKAMINNDAMSIYLIEKADHTFSMTQSRSRVISVIVDHLCNRYSVHQNQTRTGRQP